MTPEQAINILTQVANAHVGTRKDHEIIETAIKTLLDVVNGAKPLEKKSSN